MSAFHEAVRSKSYCKYLGYVASLNQIIFHKLNNYNTQQCVGVLLTVLHRTHFQLYVDLHISRCLLLAMSICLTQSLASLSRFSVFLSRFAVRSKNNFYFCHCEYSH